MLQPGWNPLHPHATPSHPCPGLEGGRLPCWLHPSGVCSQGHRVGSHIDNPDFPAHNRALAPFGFLPNHDRAGGVTQGHWCDPWIHTGSVCLGSELTGRQGEVPIPSEQGRRPQWVAPDMGHHKKPNSFGVRLLLLHLPHVQWALGPWPCSRHSWVLFKASTLPCCQQDVLVAPPGAGQCWSLAHSDSLARTRALPQQSWAGLCTETQKLDPELLGLLLHSLPGHGL